MKPFPAEPEETRYQMSCSDYLLPQSPHISGAILYNNSRIAWKKLVFTFSVLNSGTLSKENIQQQGSFEEPVGTKRQSKLTTEDPGTVASTVETNKYLAVPMDLRQRYCCAGSYKRVSWPAGNFDLSCILVS